MPPHELLGPDNWDPDLPVAKAVRSLIQQESRVPEDAIGARADIGFAQLAHVGDEQTLLEIAEVVTRLLTSTQSPMWVAFLRGVQLGVRAEQLARSEGRDP